ncbi:type II toxin-antitoxin system RelE/ParE family toxin [Aerosakkonema funiforme]|uniref:Type II toxin-antitoxin system RelE/ParE family toxin n=1 Tax=Aerosakkonema funiforme FACHB-1375 TaxID=2949571 RepID=A0A926ZE83_9CYAN|nr:type II toxin-antitoxin system RelE/ParE family toxin [Aerosakkonema funiforme]MBD2179525.1 type II toxin-antitoxin system RelE/ParE family toxin [Aerosakkonema funiforme FACHB-1375]
MSNYILSPLAIQDLDDIYDYLARKNLDAAENFVDNIEQKCQTLARFPNMGKSYENLLPQLRGVPLSNYVIFYRQLQNGIEVVRILSGYRDFEAIFSGESNGDL